MKSLSYIFLVFSQVACLSQLLTRPTKDPQTLQNGPQPMPAALPANGSVIATNQKQSPAPYVPSRATIFAVDEQTFRFQIREDLVWEAVLNVLLQNYNLIVVDRSNGIITTEWDTYYLGQTVFRNKISLRLRRLGREGVDLVVHNNVEKLQDGSAAGTVGNIWLPGDKGVKEISRIVQNMALALNQPPPVLPPTMIGYGNNEPIDKVSQ